MRIAAAMLSLRLQQNAHLRLRDAVGTSLCVTRGKLWITQAGDPADHSLRQGSAFTLDRKGLAIISAETDAEFSIAIGSGYAYWRKSATYLRSLLPGNVFASLKRATMKLLYVWPVSWLTTRQAQRQS